MREDEETKKNNFNEKLIELRKKAGFSQEELGDKLNVTRQTISKWELGQTTPEMDKLIEISKLFNVTVDELTNNKGSLNNETEDNSKRTAKIILIILGALILVAIISIILTRSFFNSFFNSFFKQSDDIMEKSMDFAQGAFDKIIDNSNKILEDAQEFTNLEQKTEDTISNDSENILSKIQDSVKAQKIQMFNNEFEFSIGDQKGFSVKTLLSTIKSSNSKNENQIIVEYEGTVYSNDDISTLIKNIVSTKDYNVEAQYNSQTKIIEKIIINED